MENIIQEGVNQSFLLFSSNYHQIEGKYQNSPNIEKNMIYSGLLWFTWLFSFILVVYLIQKTYIILQILGHVDSRNPS
jgi:hypothetical protein